MTDRLKELSDAGVSIWLDDLSRERIETGNLAELVENSSVVGVTTNPTIFAAALSQRRGLRRRRSRSWPPSDADVHDAITALTTDDVRNACDVLADVYNRDQRGRRPGLHRGRARVWPWTPRAPSPQAADLWKTVDRPNVLDQDPGHQAGAAGDHRHDRRGHQRQRHA